MTRRYIFCLAALTILTITGLYVAGQRTPAPAWDNPARTRQDAPQDAQGFPGSSAKPGSGNADLQAVAADLDALDAEVDRLEGSQRENIEKLRTISRGEGEMLMIGTAYTHVATPGVADINGTGDGLTAIGVPVHEGVVAVDPAIIPLGSLVYIKSDYPGITGYYVAGDRGADIKGLRVDIFREDKAEAFRFGKRRVRVRIVAAEGVK